MACRKENKQIKQVRKWIHKRRKKYLDEMRKIVTMIGTTDGRKDKNGEENEIENM